MDSASFKEENLNPLLVKQLPYSLESEQAVLGSIILEGDKLPDVTMILKADDFFVDRHKEIYAACQELFLKSRTIDVVTLLNTLVATGHYSEASAKSYVMQLTEMVPSISNVKDYANIVRDKSLLRKLIITAGEISQNAYEEGEDVQSILDSAEQKIFSLSQGFITQDFVSIKDAITEYYAELNLLVNDKDASKGLPTFFSELDRYIISMNPGDFILIGARPGVGKTSFALNIALPVAKRTKKAVAIFSLEMSRLQLVERMLAAEARIDSYKLRTGELSNEEIIELSKAATAISATDIYIDDCSLNSVSSMKAKLRRIKNLGLVMIDYLGLMAADRKSDSRAQEVGDISKNLKILAKELGVPIVCLAQLNRNPEKRDDKKPALSDLRDSGSIEQDADIVMFLYRPDYYDQESAEKNTAELLIAKNRHGSTGKVTLGWEPQFTKFISIDNQREEP